MLSYIILQFIILYWCCVTITPAATGSKKMTSAEVWEERRWTEMPGRGQLRRPGLDMKCSLIKNRRITLNNPIYFKSTKSAQMPHASSSFRTDNQVFCVYRLIRRKQVSTLSSDVLISSLLKIIFKFHLAYSLCNLCAACTMYEH